MVVAIIVMVTVAIFMGILIKMYSSPDFQYANHTGFRSPISMILLFLISVTTIGIVLSIILFIAAMVYAESQTSERELL